MLKNFVSRIFLCLVVIVFIGLTYVDSLNFNPPSPSICKQMNITYLKCTNYSSDSNKCYGELLRSWTATLDFEAGPNITTSFIMTPQDYEPISVNRSYLFSVNIVFGAFIPQELHNNLYVCPENSPTCQASVPYTSSIYVNITDASSTKMYDQESIQFFNGYAILDSQEGSLLNPSRVYYSPEIKGPSYTGVIFECSKTEVLQEPYEYPDQTCTNFEASVRIFDSNDTMLVDIGMEIAMSFNFSDQEMDYRSINITNIKLIFDEEPGITLMDNDNECFVDNLNQVAICDQNLTTSYFLNLDFTYFSNNLNADLHTFSSIMLYKYYHAFYRQDGSPFTSENQCDQRRVEVFDFLDHLNGKKFLGSYANTTICCNLWTSLPYAVTTRAPSTRPKPPTTSNKPTTTVKPIRTTKLSTVRASTLHSSETSVATSHKASTTEKISGISTTGPQKTSETKSLHSSTMIHRSSTDPTSKTVNFSTTEKKMNPSSPHPTSSSARHRFYGVIIFVCLLTKFIVGL